MQYSTRHMNASVQMARVRIVAVEPTKQLHFCAVFGMRGPALNINDVFLKNVRSGTWMEGAV
jgi:hypothetical protein